MKRLGTCMHRSQGGTNMVRRVSLATIIVLVNFVLVLTAHASGEELWCYDCNTDLRRGHTRECNDPYNAPPYFNLVLCPRNESQHCLKSVIDYGDMVVTVRGCVPSREIDGYCQPEEYFPGSSITCSFCNDYACNSQSPTCLFIRRNFIFLFMLINVALYLKQ